jgi:hypothetical protein
MTVFYMTNRPDGIPAYQWTGDNLAELEAWAGDSATVTANDDGTLTFATSSPFGGDSVTVPVSGYVSGTPGSHGWLPDVYATNPTSGSDALYQIVTPGQTYTLTDPS